MTAPAAAADLVRYPMPAELAAMALEGHHVVEASAGTGKTYLIERRVVDLLVRGRVPLDQILLVTFTEKATAELRRRVRALVRELGRLREDRCVAADPHWVIDGEARTALRGALHGFDQAAIHTIHGYCHRVLLDSAFDGRRPFRQTQVATEAALRDALNDCMRDTLATEEAHGELLAAWLGRGRGSKVDELAGLVGELLRMGGRLVQRYEPDAIDRGLAELAAALDDAGGPDGLGAALRADRVHGGTVKAAVARAAHLMELVELRRDTGLPGVLDELHEKVGELAGYCGKAAAPGPVTRRVCDAAAALASEAVPLPAAVAIRFLPLVRQRLEQNKAARGQFDFGDMLEQVWRALEGPGGAALAERLRRRHPHALIDEFQDTDELQWNIFRRLYLEAPAGAGNLTIVGDPKQAIYGFRGADVHTYLRARREILTGGRDPVQLTTSYRSTAPLVEALGRIFGGEPPFFSGGIEFQPVRAHAPGGGGPPLRLLDLGGVAGTDRRRAALLRHVSGEIRRLLAGGLEPGGPPVPAGDIFVLTRSTAESRDVADRLRRDGVRCALYQQEGLLQGEEAVEVRDLLAAIAAPRDRSARLRAWQTRFFAVPLAGLPELAAADDAHPLVAPLLAWRALAERLDYERLFPRILDDTRLIEREIALAPSERALTNFLHLFELLLDEMLVARCDLDELVRRLGRWMVDTEKSEERNVQRLESERDAVQIMTVHRSKGLEAQVVFLVGGDGQPPNRPVKVYHQDGERRVQVGRCPDEAVRALCDEEDRGESERLLYVALTRAARRLYLPCWLEEKPGGRRLVDLLNARVQGWLAAGGEDGLVAVEPIADDEEETGAAAPADLLATWSPPAELLREPAPAAAVTRALAIQRGPVTTSYTRMKRADQARGGELPVLDPRALDRLADLDDLDPTDPEPDAPDAPGSLAARAAAAPGGRRVGIFLHEVLERLPLASAAGPDGDDLDRWAALPAVDAVFRAAARDHDLDPDEPLWREMVWTALRLPIDLGHGLGDGQILPGVARAERHLPEVEFLFPLRGPGGEERALVRGAIDLVFAWQGRIYWLDWKSDALPDWSPEAVAAHVASEYALQADLYSLALARMIGAGATEQHEARFGGLVYLFLRGGRVHVERPGFGELRRREAALAAREVLG